MGAANPPSTSLEIKLRLQRQIGELGLPPDLADDIIGHHTLVKYDKGEIVILQGSPAEVVFCVRTGLVKVYCPRSDGSRILVKLAGPGDLIGYADYIDSRGHRTQIFEVEALTKSAVALFTREHILKTLATVEQSVLLEVIQQLNTAWSSAAHWFATFLGMSFKQRLDLVLSELGAKFGVPDARGILLTPELSHSDFADMIGSSRPMVTRLIAEMSKQGVLMRQGKRLILCQHPKISTHDSEEQKNTPVGFKPTSLLNGFSQQASHLSITSVKARKTFKQRDTRQANSAVTAKPFAN